MLVGILCLKEEFQLVTLVVHLISSDQGFANGIVDKTLGNMRKMKLLWLLC